MGRWTGGPSSGATRRPPRASGSTAGEPPGRPRAAAPDRPRAAAPTRPRAAAPDPGGQALAAFLGGGGQEASRPDEASTSACSTRSAPGAAPGSSARTCQPHWTSPGPARRVQRPKPGPFARPQGDQDGGLDLDPGGDRPVAAARPPGGRGGTCWWPGSCCLPGGGRGGRGPGGAGRRRGWLALHLVLLGAATNAIVVWSEHFAAALLDATGLRAGGDGTGARPEPGDRGRARRGPDGRSGLAAAGAGLVGVVVLGHGLSLASRIGRALPARLSMTIWFYVAAGAALLAGMGFGLWLAGGVAGSPTPTGRCGPTSTSTCSAGSAWPWSAPSSPCGRRCCAHGARAGTGRPLVAAAAGRGLAVAATGLATRHDWWRWPAWPPILPGWRSRWSRSSARPCGGRRPRRRPGCSGRAWPGWW